MAEMGILDENLEGISDDKPIPFGGRKIGAFPKRSAPGSDRTPE
jgi:hypothetical protein